MTASTSQPLHADLASRAVALREALRDKEDLPLSAAEAGLLAEWLNQLADHTERSPD